MLRNTIGKMWCAPTPVALQRKLSMSKRRAATRELRKARPSMSSYVVIPCVMAFTVFLMLQHLFGYDSDDRMFMNDKDKWF